MTALETLDLDARLAAVLAGLSPAARACRRPVRIGTAAASAVGRNDVWRIDLGGDTNHFAKFWTDVEAFDRELFGLRLMARLAADNPSIMAAQIVATDRSTGLIVTTGLAGRSLDELLRAAYRRDRLGKSAATNEVERCLAAVCELLAALHAVPVQPGPPLYDHQPPAIRARLAVRLVRAAEAGLLNPEQFAEVPWLSPGLDAAGTASLVHGDVSPGNIFFDGRRVGLIDFEDFGFGPGFRDDLTLAYALHEMNRRWSYRSCFLWKEDETDPGASSALRKLCRAELAVNRLLLLHERASGRFQRAATALERRRVLRELLALLQA